MKLFTVLVFTFLHCSLAQEQPPSFLIARDLFLRQATPSLASPKNNVGLPVEKKKSVPLAVALSLLIPGLGEWYADNVSSGQYFLLTESGLWLTYLGFDTYGTWVRDDARQYAQANASVSLNGKDEKYFVNIGNFLSVDDYNHTRLINRQTEKMYLPATQYYWKWNNEQQRLTYRTMRINSDLAFNNLKFIGIGIGLNHLASAINAALSASSQNNNPLSFRLELLHNALGGRNSQGYSLTFSTRL